MVSARKKRQSNGRLLSQSHDFDQDIILGNAARQSQENNVVNDGTNDRDSTVATSDNNSTINENSMKVKTLERCFNGSIDRQISKIVDTVEHRLQKAILTVSDNIVAPKIQLAIRSINASSGRDATSVTAILEGSEHVGIIFSFENASENNNMQQVLNGNDETRKNLPAKVSELTVPGALFDRQTHTHYMVTGQTAQTNQIP